MRGNFVHTFVFAQRKPRKRSVPSSAKDLKPTKATRGRLRPKHNGKELVDGGMEDNIIHPPHRLRRDVDKQTSRRLRSNAMNDPMPFPLKLSDSFDDIPPNAGCKGPEIFMWKRDLDRLFGTTASKPPKKNTTTYVEWKKAPTKKRKKKKNGVEIVEDGTALRESSSLQDEPTMETSSSLTSSSSSTSTTRRTRTNGTGSCSGSSRSYDPEHPSRKENTAPSQQQFKPSFSRSRYSNLQKFRTLSAYYRQKEQLNRHRGSKGDDDPSDGHGSGRNGCEGSAVDGREDRGGPASAERELENTKGWATAKRNGRRKGKRVQFAHPLITQLKYRPKTRPDEIDRLYFREEEIQEWEEDRETTSPEFVELVITGDDVEEPVCGTEE